MSLQRPGQVDNSGDAKALFENLFLTETIAAYNEYNVLDGRTQSRQITHGKSATFPVLWKTLAQYFIPGTTADLAGTNNVAHTSLTINVDAILEADILTPEIDELMNHFDVRQEYSKQMGQALARKSDQQKLRLLILAARKTTGDAATKGLSAARTVSAANMRTDASVIVQSLFNAVADLSTRDVPEDGLFAVLKPAQYFLLAQNSLIASKDYGNGNSIMTARVGEVAGLTVLKSNNLPQNNDGSAAVIAGATGEENTYSGTFTKTVGVVAHSTAIATVKLMNLAFESEWLIQKQATLMVAKHAIGHGITRPEASVELVIP